MGTSNSITRGQLRPHFAGRSPPFLVAALCVGIGILGVSYWSLSTQYNDLEEQLRKALQRKDTLENGENVMHNQLTLREEEFSRAKVLLQKKEELLQQLNKQIKDKDDEITSINSQLESFTESNTKCKDDLNKKDNEIGDFKTKFKEIEEQKNNILKEKDHAFNQLANVKKENDDLKKQIIELKNHMKISADGGNYSSSATNSLKSAVQPPNIDTKSSSSVQLTAVSLPKDENSVSEEKQISKPKQPSEPNQLNDNNIAPPKQETDIKSNDVPISGQLNSQSGQLLNGETIKTVQEAPVAETDLGESLKREENLLNGANEIGENAKDELNKDGDAQ